MHEMEILTSVLKRLETKESGSDVEKINELIKVRNIYYFFDVKVITVYYSYTHTHRVTYNAVN